MRSSYTKFFHDEPIQSSSPSGSDKTIDLLDDPSTDTDGNLQLSIKY